MQHTAACDDCVVSVLLVGDTPIEFADAEMVALENLSGEGLVAPLRLVSRNDDADAATG